MLTTVNDNDPKSINISLHSLQTEIDSLQKMIDSLVKNLEGTTNYVLGEVGSIEYPVTSVNNQTGDVILDYNNVSALPNTTTHLSGDVPITRTVNAKTLSADITLSASDVGAVPTTRTVNGKTLSSNITLSASDVGAMSSSYTAPVTSVNGKTGAVTLSASDVSALSSSDLPTIRTSSTNLDDYISSANVSTSSQIYIYKYGRICHLRRSIGCSADLSFNEALFSNIPNNLCPLSDTEIISISTGGDMARFYFKSPLTSSSTGSITAAYPLAKSGNTYYFDCWYLTS